jgi:hypothetical protein
MGLTNDKGEKLTCSWSYAVQVIDRKDGKLKVLNLKKKMFESLIKFCKDAKRDPTHPETGFDVVLDRVKTGAFAYNVDYNLNQVKMLTAGPQPFSEEDELAVKELKSIDEVIPRPTSDEQKAALLKFLEGDSSTDESGTSENTSGAASEAISELDNM